VGGLDGGLVRRLAALPCEPHQLARRPCPVKENVGLPRTR
jgi:hypothetical protein